VDRSAMTFYISFGWS